MFWKLASVVRIEPAQIISFNEFVHTIQPFSNFYPKSESRLFCMHCDCLHSRVNLICVLLLCFFFRMCLLPSGTWTSSYIANLPIAIGILAFLNFLIYFVTILLFQLNSVSTIVNMQNNDMFDCVYNMRSAAGDMLSE